MGRMGDEMRSEAKAGAEGQGHSVIPPKAFTIKKNSYLSLG